MPERRSPRFRHPCADEGAGRCLNRALSGRVFSRTTSGHFKDGYPVGPFKRRWRTPRLCDLDSAVGVPRVPGRRQSPQRCRRVLCRLPASNESRSLHAGHSASSVAESECRRAPATGAQIPFARWRTFEAAVRASERPTLGGSRVGGDGLAARARAERLDAVRGRASIRAVHACP